MPKFTDETLMPFGKFAKTKLEDVPASYLLWLYDKMKDDDDKVRLFLYIYENKALLEQEAKAEKPER